MAPVAAGETPEGKSDNVSEYIVGEGATCRDRRRGREPDRHGAHRETGQPRPFPVEACSTSPERSARLGGAPAPTWAPCRRTASASRLKEPGDPHADDLRRHRRLDSPTTLALAWLDEAGAACTCSGPTERPRAELSADQGPAVAAEKAPRILYVGTPRLGCWSRMASSVETVAGLPDDVLLDVDPNCRPTIPEAYPPGRGRPESSATSRTSR